MTIRPYIVPSSASQLPMSRQERYVPVTTSAATHPIASGENTGSALLSAPPRYSRQNAITSSPPSQVAIAARCTVSEKTASGAWVPETAWPAPPKVASVPRPGSAAASSSQGGLSTLSIRCASTTARQASSTSRADSILP